MLFVRSLAFNLAFYAWTVLMVIGHVWTLAAPPRRLIAAQRRWAKGVNWLLRRLAGIEIEIRGARPRPPCIVASKHQSAWDTMIWHVELDAPAIVMKRELLAIPIYGQMCRRSGMIPIDRKGGAKALKAMLEEAKRAIADGRAIVVFPQGTRTAPGLPVEAQPYQPGVAAIYRAVGAPCVPVALNSGLFWPRRGFRKRPGRITLEFLPPIPPGLPRRSFLPQLAEAIDSASDRLARQESPHATVSNPVEKSAVIHRRRARG